ncbi:MAG: Lrp/AsnC family transcriptional regulator [Terricaulis sp.]
MTRLDSIDVELVRLLQLDARLSMRRLAQAVGLSSSATWDRVKRLEQRSLILGYTVIIAPSELASEIDVIIRLQIRTDAPGKVREFESQLKKSTEFVSARRISRPGTYELRTVSRSAIPWLEGALARCGLVALEFESLFVVEEIVPHRDPAIRALIERE